MVYTVALRYAPYQPSFEFEDPPQDIVAYGFSTGQRIDAPERFPKSAIQTDEKKLSDVFPLPALTAVSDRFRSIVEEFEPGVREFYPIQLKRKDGTPYTESYYVFNACQCFDAVLVKQSACSDFWGSIRAGRFEGRPLLGCRDSGLVFSRPKIGNRHVWKGQIIGGAKLFVSDQVGKAFQKSKIKYLDMDHNEEVDQAWLPEENISPVLDWIKENSTSGFKVRD